MDIGNYWTSVVRKRLNRRRALTLAAGGAAAALIGAACGGDDDGESTARFLQGEGAPFYAWQYPDERANAMLGGIYRDVVTTEPTESFDPFRAQQQFVASVVYEPLIRFLARGPGMDPNDPKTPPSEIGGWLSQSYEAGADAASLTFKLKPNVRFHNIAPVNGRVMEIDDWRSTWERFSATSPFRTVLTAIIDRAEFPDAQNMVFKLKEPYAPAINLFTAAGSQFWIIPKELNANPTIAATNAIGTYQYQLDSYQPSVGFEFKKNPNWHYRAGRPFMERVHYPVIPDASNRLAQFITGGLFAYTPPGREVIQVRKDVPQARMVKGTDVGATVLHMWFGLREFETSPWRDERVRQALSMLMDRQRNIDFFSNNEELTAAGLGVDTRWHTHVKASREEYLLDARKDQLGPASKFFKYDPAEARKLMDAAGFRNGIDLEAHFSLAPQYGSTFPDRVQVTLDLWEQSGLVKVKRTSLEFQDYQNRILTWNPPNSARDFKGIAMGFDFGSYAEVDQELFNFYHSKGSRFKGIVDQKVDDLAQKQRVELDTEKRAELIREIQKYMAQKMYTIPWDGASSGYTFRHRWVRNIAWSSWEWWLDETTPNRNG